jgi:hypothetical protein
MRIMALDKEAAIALLSREVPVSAEPVLSEEDLEDLVALMAIQDPDGRAPADEAWEPTYSRARLPYAAADAFERKAGRVANLASTVVPFQGTFSAGELHKQFLTMARRYRAKCYGTATVRGGN